LHEPGSRLAEAAHTIHELQHHLEQRFRTLHEAFLKVDADRSGMVSVTEIKRLCQEYNLADCSEEVLGYFDIDNNQELDYQEFMHVLSFENWERHHSSHAAEVAELVAKPKKTRTPEEEAKLEQKMSHVVALQGRIDAVHASQDEAKKETSKLVEQLARKLEQRFSSLREAFLKVDEDRSGKISKDEITLLCKLYNLHEKSDLVMAAFDVDHNGLLDYQEFAKVLQGHF
jgi:Ca2+-binding EF-hand superfamily protein